MMSGDRLLNANDVTNEQVILFSEAALMQTITQPLRKYGITYFSYSCLYPGGVDNWMTTDPRAQQIFLDYRYYQHVFLGDITQYSPCVVRWDDLAKNDSVMMEYMGVLKREINVASGLTIVKPRSQRVEFYYFGAPSENIMANYFFMSHIDLLHHFIDYFDDVAAPLKLESYKNRLYYPGHQDKTLLIDPSINFLSTSAQNSSGSFEFLACFYDLTQREKECALYSAQGMSCKEIARVLQRSDRTVEKQLQSLKRKTNSKTISQVIAKLSGSFARNAI